MNIDPQLVKLLTGNTIQQRQNTYDQYPEWYRGLMDAQRESYKAIPNQEQFNGIIDPGDIPNSLVIPPDDFMNDMATQQSSEQPNYRPEIPDNLYDPNPDRMKNILRLLENYQNWKRGESH